MREKIRTEAFDRMQYLYASFHDPAIRARLCFSGRIDADALRRAVGLSADAVPQVRLRFDPERGLWSGEGVSSEEIVQVVEAEDGGESTASRLLLSPIEFFKGPQVKIFLVRGNRSDTLCVVFSHLVGDGAGFRRYLSLLSELYARCLERTEPAALRPMDRGFRQVMRGFGRQEKIEILAAPMDYPKQDPSMLLPLKEERGEPFLAERTLGEETLAAMKAYAKGRGATVNDLLMAAFARAHRAVTGCGELVLSCPVDLRKYAPDPDRCGITNLSGTYLCTLSSRENEPFDVTLLLVSMQMHAQKNSLACLKGPLLLDWINRFLPFSSFRKIFSEKFQIPVVSYTNLGVFDRDRLRFGGAGITDVRVATAVKHAPAFQVSASTFDGRCTLSCCADYREEDRKVAESFLGRMAEELKRLRASDESE